MQVRTHQNDTVDQLCWRHLGKTERVVEATLELNPGLAAAGPILPAGMAISVGLSMVRVLTGISILWLLVPGYALALGLSFVVPKIFTSIAFDSGGVASGPMTATFLLSFAMGACDAAGGNVLTDAFGIVAMVAMTPLIIIQLIGLLYRMKVARTGAATPQESADEVIDLSKEVEL